MNALRRLFFPLIGFIVGIFFFFPWSQVKDIIIAQVAKNAHISLQMQTFQPTLGLRLGLAKGSLFGFSSTKSIVRTPGGNTLSCDELILAPRIWPFFIGQLHIGVGCYDAKGGELVLLTRVSPIWSPSKLDESVYMNKFSLDNVELRTIDVHGTFSGNIEADNISLTGEKGVVPNVKWRIKAAEFRSPDVASPLMSLPSLDLGDLETAGTFTTGAINVSQLDFGNKGSSIQGDLTFRSDFSMANYSPENGEIAGTLRVAPDVEATTFKSINLTTLLGQPNSNGARKFKRQFTGGIMSLLMKKYDGGTVE